MRTCGECTLCCKLLPVRELEKPANTRCQHQCSKGCKVYHTAEMPVSCKVWNCRWLVNDDTHDLPRPDRCGYVIDTMPDIITVEDRDGNSEQFLVVQIWAEKWIQRWPKSLLKYLERRSKEDVVGLIRFSNNDAVTIWMRNGKWVERPSVCSGISTLDKLMKGMRIEP